MQMAQQINVVQPHFSVELQPFPAEAPRGLTAQPPLAVVGPDPAARAEDEALMERVRAGDPAGLEGLYDRHHRAAMALALRMLGDRAAAEDVIQESFLAAWRRASSFDAAKGNVRRWLLSIVHHRCIDRLRRIAVGGPTAELGES